MAVQELAVNKELYYEAMLRCAQKQAKGDCSPSAPISPFRKAFTYGFKPDYMLDVLNSSKRLIRQIKILYGASQLDN